MHRLYRYINRMPNAPVREMCGVKKEMDEWIDENALQRYGYMERKVD